MNMSTAVGPWHATTRDTPLAHQLSLPGSKSLTNRELVLAALALAPSTLRSPLHARDTRLMVEALQALGAQLKRWVPGYLAQIFWSPPYLFSTAFRSHRLWTGGNRHALCAPTDGDPRGKCPL